MIFVTLILIGIIIGTALYTNSLGASKKEQVYALQESVRLGTTLNILPLLDQGIYHLEYAPDERFNYCISSPACKNKVLIIGKDYQRSYTYSETENLPSIRTNVQKNIIITNAPA
ncbi:MAG: hypothetical protein Q7R96_03405 [Nanoarchaeota archaeon]|nr:hypothetical protein [Nanoarchaeota archaeon]